MSDLRTLAGVRGRTPQLVTEIGENPTTTELERSDVTDTPPMETLFKPDNYGTESKAGNNGIKEQYIEDAELNYDEDEDEDDSEDNFTYDTYISNTEKCIKILEELDNGNDKKDRDGPDCSKMNIDGLINMLKKLRSDDNEQEKCSQSSNLDKDMGNLKDDADFNTSDDDYNTEDGDFNTSDDDYNTEDGDFNTSDDDYNTEDGDFNTSDDDYNTEDGYFDTSDDNNGILDKDSDKVDEDFEDINNVNVNEDNLMENENNVMEIKNGDNENELDKDKYINVDKNLNNDGNDKDYNDKNYYEEIVDDVNTTINTTTTDITATTDTTTANTTFTNSTTNITTSNITKYVDDKNTNNDINTNANSNGNSIDKDNKIVDDDANDKYGNMIETYGYPQEYQITNSLGVGSELKIDTTNTTNSNTNNIIDDKAESGNANEYANTNIDTDIADTKTDTDIAYTNTDTNYYTGADTGAYIGSDMDADTNIDTKAKDYPDSDM